MLMTVNRLLGKTEPPKRLLHVILDNRERKLMALLDERKDIITYDSEQLDIADVVNSFHLKLEIVYKSYQRTEFFLYIWMVYPYYKKIFKL